jgi:hypothetical protein
MSPRRGRREEPDEPPRPFFTFTRGVPRILTNRLEGPAVDPEGPAPGIWRPEGISK